MKYFWAIILLATSVAASLFTDDFTVLLVRGNRDKNVIASPLSVEMILSMVYMGTSGQTAEELRRRLNLPEDIRQVAQYYKDFLDRLRYTEKVAILELANRIYINNRYSLVPEFNQLTQYGFNSEAEAISLLNPVTAASIVNKWVDDKTHGRIKDIVTPGDMNSNLVAILLNAIYFKGQWQYQFEAKNTRPEQFRFLYGGSTSVQMMTLNGTFRAGTIDALDCKVLELPYRNSSLSMVIFLPNQVDGLLRLPYGALSIGFAKGFQERDVFVKLPKFKIEFEADLGKVLYMLRIRNAFAFSDDFNGLVRGPQLRIEKVLQKAFIEVNEEGAEAAAVTSVSLSNRCLDCGPPPPMKFVADHPFFFVIRDATTVYFAGQVTNPTY